MNDVHTTLIDGAGWAQGSLMVGIESGSLTGLLGEAHVSRRIGAENGGLSISLSGGLDSRRAAGEADFKRDL
ncbi:MAG TPA: hypothetical protein VGA77_09320 [Propylenella sp.]